MSKFVRVTLAGSLISIASAHADILVRYDFENSNRLTPGTVASGAIAGNISPSLFGTGGFVTSTTNSPDAVGNLAIQFLNIEEGPAPTDGNPAPDYIEFTLTPSVPGTALKLDSLTFLSRLNGETSGPGGFYTIQYDDLSDAAGFQLLAPSIHDTNSTVKLQLVDLSSASFQNLTAGITFRINFTEPAGGSPANDGNNSMKVDNITVNGVMIPEPASSALLLAGGILLARRRRQRPA